MSDRLELLNARRAALQYKERCRQLQSMVDSLERRMLTVEMAHELVRTAFLAEVPMDRIMDMVVTSEGVAMKEKKDA